MWFFELTSFQIFQIISTLHITKTLTGALISPFPFQDYRKMVDRLRITINWNHAGRSMTHSYYNFYLKFGFHCQFDRQKTAGYGLPDNKKESVSLEINNLINIWQMFNLAIDNLAVKPYIPHKSLLQWICCKCLAW